MVLLFFFSNYFNNLKNHFLKVITLKLYFNKAKIKIASLILVLSVRKVNLCATFNKTKLTNHVLDQL